MPEHITKVKGDTGLGFVMADLMSKGIAVALPISEHLPFDCIAILPNGKMLKISVKYRTAVDERVDVPMKSVWSNSKGCHTRPYGMDEFDILAIYCPDTNGCYYVPRKEITTTALTLCVLPPKLKLKTTKMGDEYRDPVKILGSVGELVKPELC